VFDDGGGEALFLVGGFEVDEETGYRQYTNDVWKSVDGIQWEQIRQRTYPVDDMDADFMPRFNHVCIAVTQGGTDYLYLIGGSTMLEDYEGAYATVYFRDVWRSQDGLNWEKLDNDDYGQRAELAAWADEETGRIYIHGGSHGTGFDNEELLNHPVEDYYCIWYSDDGVNWVADESMPLVRASHSLMRYHGSLWLFPGTDGSFMGLRFAEEDLYYTYYKEEGEDWSLDSEGSAFSARHSYASVIFNDRIWILGGETADNGPNNDVWSGRIVE